MSRVKFNAAVQAKVDAIQERAAAYEPAAQRDIQELLLMLRELTSSIS